MGELQAPRHPATGLGLQRIGAGQRHVCRPCFDPTDLSPRLQNCQGRRVGRQSIAYDQGVVEQGFTGVRPEGTGRRQRQTRGHSNI